MYITNRSGYVLSTFAHRKYVGESVPFSWHPKDSGIPKDVVPLLTLIDMQYPVLLVLTNFSLQSHVYQDTYIMQSNVRVSPDKKDNLGLCTYILWVSLPVIYDIITLVAYLAILS